MESKRVKIFPITYFDTPVLNSSIYTPIFASNKYFTNHAKFLDSNSLDNDKYNELTAIYDIWKLHSENLDFIGICHYRRLLSFNSKSALSHRDIQSLIFKNEIILPKKRVYWPLNLKQHYIYSKKGYFKVHLNDIKIVKDIFIEIYPDYLKSFNRVMKRTYYHGGHIFLMNKNLFDSYCEFTFNIAFEIEKRLSSRIDQKRYISALTEFTLDIWIDRKRLKYKEINVYETEKVPFFKKILVVLKKIFKG
jgi:hypothetical protein